MSVSTHVLDTSAGRPAAGVGVVLLAEDGRALDERVTDGDGRVPALAGADRPGVYRLVFDTAALFGGRGFYPRVEVAFRIADAAEHHHVPLLLSPFGYSTYRGS